MSVMGFRASYDGARHDTLGSQHYCDFSRSARIFGIRHYRRSYLDGRQRARLSFRVLFARPALGTNHKVRGSRGGCCGGGVLEFLECEQNSASTVSVGSCDPCPCASPLGRDFEC